MKLYVLAALFAATEAIQRHHSHRPHYDQFVQTLPDERAATVSDADIASHENARSEAAKIKPNPERDFFQYVHKTLDQINKDMSFGVSFSQTKRNDHARSLCTELAGELKYYAKTVVDTVNSGPNETITEANAHNMAQALFFDVQLQDYMKGLGMSPDEELNLNMNRLKSLQKLYLFEQKGGENYLG